MYESVSCRIGVVGKHQHAKPLSQVDRPVDHVEEEEGEGEEGSCIEVDAFGSSRYDGFRWRRFLVGFVLGLEGSRHFHWFTVAVEVGKFKVSR